MATHQIDSDATNADTAFECGFSDALENRVSVEYLYRRTRRERDDYITGYRCGRLSRGDLPVPMSQTRTP